tara:strand:- start:858 stop:1295 length:438 start_codon:yes stop_codon:yes gene_type:complete
MLNKCKEIKNSDEYIIYKVTHGLLIISSFITTVTYSIAVDNLKPENDLFVGWCLGSAVFSLIYGSFCLYIDFKRDVYFQRNNVTFLIFDFFEIFFLFSISVSGSILWKYGDNDGKNSFDTGNVFSWITLLIAVIITYQDYKQSIE